MFNVWLYTECCICKEGMYLQRRDHDTWRINWNPDIYRCKMEDMFRVLFRDTTYHEITNVASYQTLYNIWDVMYTRSRTCNVLKVDPCLISEATMLILSCYLSREGGRCHPVADGAIWPVSERGYLDWDIKCRCVRRGALETPLTAAIWMMSAMVVWLRRGFCKKVSRETCYPKICHVTRSITAGTSSLLFKSPSAARARHTTYLPGRATTEILEM